MILKLQNCTPKYCVNGFNLQVYKILKESQTGGQRQRNDPLATIRYETLEYFKKTPCVAQSDEVIKTFLESLKHHKQNLNQEEILVLLNNRPTNPVEISYMVDEDRADETIVELLKIVAECLPPPPDQ
ncbi:hypothetical protein B566_EDAN017039 [Ephemera danica]|nr:hypothetical protein B566_EDAN017039 [Ephemera danica]